MGQVATARFDCARPDQSIVGSAERFQLRRASSGRAVGSLCAESPASKPAVSAIAMPRSRTKLRLARYLMRRRTMPAHLGLGLCECLSGPSAWPADNPAEALELERVEVIGTTPL